MPNDKSPPEPETVAQKEAGEDCVSLLVRLGVKLHPWQVKIIEAMNSGKRITIIHARPRRYRCFVCRDTGKTDGALGFNGHGSCPLCSLSNAEVSHRDRERQPAAEQPSAQP